MKRVFLSLCILSICIALTTADRSFAQAGTRKGSDSAKPNSDKQTRTQNSLPEKDVVIGHLKTKDRLVTVTRGSKGTFYTIKTKDGKTLATKLNEKDLQAKYPDIYHQIKSGVAGNDATLR